MNFLNSVNTKVFIFLISWTILISQNGVDSTKNKTKPNSLLTLSPERHNKITTSTTPVPIPKEPEINAKASLLGSPENPKLVMEQFQYDERSFIPMVIGTSGFNFSRYIHVIGETCKETDLPFYRKIYRNFESCLESQDHLVQPSVWSAQLKSTSEICADWRIYRNCYTILSLEIKQCVSQSYKNYVEGGDSRRGIPLSELSFLEAYGDVICGGRYSRVEMERFSECHWRQSREIIWCAPERYDREAWLNDCSKLGWVQNCYEKCFNFRRCSDLQPLNPGYLENLFRDLNFKLGCSQSSKTPSHRNDPDWPLLEPLPSTSSPTAKRPRPWGSWGEGEWGWPRPWKNETIDQGGMSGNKNGGIVVHVHGDRIQILTGNPRKGYQLEIKERGLGQARNNNPWRQVRTEDGVILTKGEMNAQDGDDRSTREIEDHVDMGLLTMTGTSQAEESNKKLLKPKVR